MIPDKLYAKICHPISDEYTEITAFEDKWDNEAIEYICKGALLEWAKERQAFYRKKADDVEDDDSGMAYFCGKEYAFKELIDKLESL